ncbi:MAG TPA: hypothetical protein VIZ64_00640 [Dokdonella sp.]
MANDVDTRAEVGRAGDWVVTGTQTAATDDSHSRVEVIVRGSVNGSVDRGGGSDQLRFSVWDDGQEKAFKIVDIPLGRSGVVTVRLGFEGRYLTVADGIGITITAGSEIGGERVFDLDPFFPVKN